jgi:hypothetical protein
MIETCPKCGARGLSPDSLVAAWYCGTVQADGYAVHESTTCLRSQLAAESQLKEAAEARAAGLTWVNADERLPPFGSYALCQFGSEILGAGVGVCKLTGSDFMSEWIFADRFSVFVKAWMKVNVLLAPAAEEGAGDGK